MATEVSAPVQSLMWCPSNPTLVGFVGADGENQHWILDSNGNIKKGRPGIRLRTIPEFCAQVPKTYNKVTSNRLLGSPLLACTLDWDSYFDGAFNEIGGITSGLGRSNIQKNAEPHAFYLFKNKDGRVAFQYKTKHDIILDNEWQGEPHVYVVVRHICV